jgi:hypothetical protein
MDVILLEQSKQAGHAVTIQHYINQYVLINEEMVRRSLLWVKLTVMMATLSTEMDAMTNDKYRLTGSAQEDLLRHQAAEKLALLKTELNVRNLISISAKNEWMGTHY